MRYWLFCSTFVLFYSPARSGAQAPAPARAVLEGEVVNAVTGAPIARARVKLETGQDEPLYTRADELGRFVFGDLAPGSYKMFAESPGFLESGLSYANVTPSPGADGTSRAHATIRLTAYAVITGKITDPYGVPVANCMVEILRKQAVRPGAKASPSRHLLPGGQTEITTRNQPTTNDKGEFRAARLEPGTYYVVTGPPRNSGALDSAYRNTYYPRALDLESAKPLELAAGQQVRADIQILRQSGVRVAGRLVKPPGEEISAGSRLNTTVVLEPEQAYLLNPHRPFTHARDDYEFSEVLPGKYTLMAVTRDAASDSSDVNQKPVFGAMKKVEIGDRDMAGLDVALQPLRDIAGVVTFPEGCAAVPLRIRAQGHRALSFGQVEAVSGADGKFLLSGVATGRFTLYITTKEGNFARVSSIRLGDRDVLKDGFEMPYSGDDSLRVSVDCPQTRRPQ